MPIADSSRLAQLLGVLSLAATDRFRERVDDSLGRSGGHAAALVHVDAHPGGSIEELRRVLDVSQPGAVSLAGRLEGDGLLERRAGPDGRTRALHLTPAGQAAARAVLRDRDRELDELVSPLDTTERAALEPLLAKLVSALADDRPRALRVCRMCDRERCCNERVECPLEHTVVTAP